MLQQRTGILMQFPATRPETQIFWIHLFLLLLRQVCVSKGPSSSLPRRAAPPTHLIIMTPWFAPHRVITPPTPLNYIILHIIKAVDRKEMRFVCAWYIRWNFQQVVAICHGVPLSHSHSPPTKHYQPAEWHVVRPIRDLSHTVSGSVVVVPSKLLIMIGEFIMLTFPFAM